MKITVLKLVTTSVLLAALAACGGGGGSVNALPDTPSSTSLTVTGTAATGLAIAGATVTGKCKVGTATATTLANGTFTLTVIDGQLPCVLQVTNPADGTKLHTLVFGTGNTAVANITPLTEMTTARVLGSEPNVFFAAFDAAVATQKVTTANVATAQTAIDLVFTGTIDTTPIGDFITTSLVAATQGSPTSGDAQDKLLDTLKLKLTTTQLGTVTTALANNQTTDAIKQTVINLTTAPSAPPVANAGTDQSVLTGSTVTLDASTSSATAGKTLTYAWTLASKPIGSAATLAASTTATPTFVADVAGSYVAAVIVNDGTTNSSAVAVTVTASVVNAAPVANAGVAQNVVAGIVVTLDGSASSDANSDPLTYVWTLTSKPVGSTAAVSSATSVKPTFTADVAGIYVASLIVNDGKADSLTMTVRITAALANVAPVANAGVTQNVVTGSVVTLDGSASSDANSDPLTYAWTLTTKPANSSASLNVPSSVKPTFTPDLAGTYVATLYVNDGKVGSTPMTITITAVLAKYFDNGDGSVTDPLTGLIWTRCAMNQTWDGLSCTGTASSYTWDQASALTGTITYASQSDWRLPNIRELETIVDRSVFSPSIDNIGFPNTQSSGAGSHFWSATPDASNVGNAWAVSFIDGEVYNHIRTNGFGVRLVRGGQAFASLLSTARPSSDYFDNSDGTVTHTPTNLTWKHCAEGQTWTGTSCTGTAIDMVAEQARLASSVFAGKSDWRLPSAKELLSLADFTTWNPAINLTISPVTLRKVLWSSTPDTSTSGRTWFVDFTYGRASSGQNNQLYGIRLVRGGQQ